MEILLTLALPRDAASVPLARSVLSTSLMTLKADEGCVNDLKVALTEACSNVLRHSDEHDEYVVTVRVDDAKCSLQVIDRGAGVDGHGDALGRMHAEPSAESGRGVQLMRALVDDVRFVSKADEGGVVELVKQLDWADDSPVVVLAQRAGPGSPSL